MPQKESVGGSEEHPCDLFSRIKFPVDEFYPPKACEMNDYKKFKED